MRKPCIAMQTDFGVSSGAMFGVCKSVDPALEVFDIAHNIPKFNIEKRLVEPARCAALLAKGASIRLRRGPGRGHLKKGERRAHEKRLLYRFPRQRQFDGRGGGVRHR